MNDNMNNQPGVSPSSDDERRNDVRSPVTLAATMEILAPEETFSAFQFQGNIVNMSAFGMRVTLQKMTREDFQKLIRGRRHARLLTRLPGEDSDLRIYGRVVWYDFRGADENPICHIGFSFGPESDEDVQRIHKFLARIRQ